MNYRNPYSFRASINTREKGFYKRNEMTARRQEENNIFYPLEYGH